MDLESRLRNKTFIAASISFVLLVLKTWTKIKLPDGIDQIVSAALALLVGAGVLIDPTTPGITDK